MFKIFNVIILIMSLWFGVKILSNDEKNNLYLFSISLSLFWLLGNQILRESVLWISGSFNYLIPFFLMVMFFYFFIHNDTKPKRILALCLSVIVSLTTEITSVILIVISTIVIFYQYKKRQKFYASNLAIVILEILGLLFLVLSPGMHIRMGSNPNFTVFLWKSLINFNTFMQKAWEDGGMGIIISFAMFFCALCSYKILKRKVMAVLMAIMTFAPLLTMSGILYSGWVYIALSIASLALLIWYSIVLFIKNDNITIIIVICLILSFGVMSAAGVICYRVLFLPAICLLLIGLRSITLIGFNQSVLLVICVCASVLSFVNLNNIVNINHKNALIWDENQHIIEEYDNGDMLELKNMADEMFLQSGIPLREHLGHEYLTQFNIPENTIVVAKDEEYYTVIDKENNCITKNAIDRNGVGYIWCRDLSTYLGAECNWNYECAEISYNKNLYRFCCGAHSVMTNYVGGTSKKLDNVVRIVNGSLYISIDDANKLFDIDLRFIKDKID